MKRTYMSAILGGAAVFLAAAVLCVGCKPSGDANPKDGGDKGGAATLLDEGAQALQSEDWARAYDKFTDAIAADDKNVDAYYGRAAAAGAIAEGHYRLAQAAATNEDVKSGEEEAKKADEYFKKSVDDCDKILSLDPQYADAYFLKGVAAQYQGAWEDGIAAFTECVKLDPSRAEAYHHRGEIYSNIGDYMNSGLDFKKASELGYTDGSEAADASASSDPADFSDLNYDAAEGDAASGEEGAEKTDAGE